jgi:hypothetical protein
MWKAIAKGLVRRLILVACIGVLLFLIQPLVTRLPAVHALMVILLFLFAWEYVV